jgi:PAS domain S-box-containing protein
VALLERELRLREPALQAISEGLVITDPNQPDNPIIYANPGFERITGYTQAEVLGRNCRFLQGPRTDPATAAALRQAVRAGQPWKAEIVNYRKDGTPLWNCLSISLLRDGAGRVTHFVGVLADVTERRLLEEQYRQAQKMEAVGRLAGGVAHDFNNLICVVSGYSELLLNRLPASSPLREAVGHIKQAGDQAAALTRHLLTFSRKQILSPHRLDLNAIVQHTSQMLRRVIGEDIELITRPGPDLWSVEADPGQLEQVLMNLAVNARDAMPQGGRLTIETRNVEVSGQRSPAFPEAGPGPHVLLTVRDTGCGMDAEVRARLFEPFFSTKGEKGTGLGLATVYGVVRQSRGFIDVQSEPGRGTTFHLCLPAVRAKPPAATISPALAALLRGTERVLLVEDQDAVRALERHILAGCGYTVLAAGGGPEALRLAEQQGRIDLLVTDVVMSGMSGREMAERLRARQPDVKVLFLSGYADDALLRHGVCKAEVAFCAKPFTAHWLAVKVREVLNSNRCATPAGQSGAPPQLAQPAP